MADDRDDLVVDELLRNLRRGARVGRVVLCIELERHLLAADRESLRVDLLDREARTIFVVLTKVGDAARQRCDMADLDDLVGGSVRGGCGQQHSRRADRQQLLHLDIHVSLQFQSQENAFTDAPHRSSCFDKKSLDIRRLHCFTHLHQLST
ncbi:hypothetical protein X977_5377 [Burkholderia pseudomallei MSHR7504]|nr:hypothetical protein X977_5377 [Burkholderia pseudomallei MSHR7504]